VQAVLLALDQPPDVRAALLPILDATYAAAWATALNVRGGRVLPDMGPSLAAWEYLGAPAAGGGDGAPDPRAGDGDTQGS
jgi:hypothetical protein